MEKISRIDLLMKLDRGKIAEVPTKTIKAKWLSEQSGSDIDIVIKAISGDQYSELSSMAYSAKKNRLDTDKIYDVNALIVLEGTVDPDFKDKELQKHFGAATPKELVKILFPGGELNEVAKEIGILSRFVDPDEDDDEDETIEDEVKN